MDKPRFWGNGNPVRVISGKGWKAAETSIGCVGIKLDCEQKRGIKQALKDDKNITPLMQVYGFCQQSSGLGNGCS